MSPALEKSSGRCTYLGCIETQARNKEPEASRERRRKGGPERRERWATRNTAILSANCTARIKPQYP